jgi:hypothetical protein
MPAGAAVDDAQDTHVGMQNADAMSWEACLYLDRVSDVASSSLTFHSRHWPNSTLRLCTMCCREASSPGNAVDDDPHEPLSGRA